MEQFFSKPLRNYDDDYVDVFLEALSMAFEVNIIIFQSNEYSCEILNSINAENDFQHTLYFVRTESMHFDPVILRHTPQVEDDTSVSVEEEFGDEYRNDHSSIEKDDESDDSVIIVDDFKNETDVLKMKDRVLKKEEDTADEMLRKFDFMNPKAEDVFHCVLIEPSRYEVTSPPKQVKGNRLYTIKNCLVILLLTTIELITRQTKTAENTMFLDTKTAVMRTPCMKMTLGDIIIKFVNPDPMRTRMLVTRRFIYCIGITDFVKLFLV